MMLQALVAYAKREGLGDLDFGTRAVDYELRIDDAGTFVGLTSLAPTKGRAKIERAPIEPQRTGPGRPAFLVDNAQYVLCSPKEGAKREGDAKKCFDTYAGLVAAAAENTKDAGLTALSLFLGRREERQRADEALADQERKKSTKAEAQEKNAAARANAVLVPVLASTGDRVHDRDAVREWWSSNQQAARDQAAGGPLGTCLVTGERAAIARTHPSVKGPPFGGLGAILVSFNEPSYQSQGLDQGDNAPVSAAAARAYTAALNDGLLARNAEGRRKSAVDLDSENVVVFWTRDVSDAAGFVLDVLAPPTEDRDARDAANSPWRGAAPAAFNDTAFYAMTLGPNAGRVVVKDWLETTAAKVKASLDRWFDDLRLTEGADETDVPPVPLRRLLDSLQAAPGAKGDARGLPPSLASTVFRAALMGAPLPRQLLAMAVQRMRVPPDARDKYDHALHHRVAIIKAVLRRTYEREVTVSLDESNDDRAYLLGRLFAAIEKLQSAAAGGNLNATIRDRYYGSASTSPAAVFGRLLSLSMHHASKTKDDGRGIIAEKAKSEIMARLPAARFPRTLGLDEQGLFAIGYYHQRAAFFRTRETQPSMEGETPS